MKLGIMETRLIRENNLPENFHFFHWQCFPGDCKPTIYFQVKGAIAPPYTRGPKKGRPNFKKRTSEQVFIVTVDKLRQWELDYETETGKCHTCKGECRTVESVHSDGAKTYRECFRCKGSGLKQ